MPSRRIFLGSDGLGALPAVIGGPPPGLRAAFVPVAAAPLEDKSFLEKDRGQLRALGFELLELDFDSLPLDECERLADGCDLLAVSGGNSSYLLHRLRESGFGRLIERWVRAGRPYAGVSAGAVVLAPSIEPLAALHPPELRDLLGGDFRGLGLVPFLVLPHADAPAEKAAYGPILRDYQGEMRLVPLTDRQAVLVLDEEERLVESPPVEIGTNQTRRT